MIEYLHLNKEQEEAICEMYLHFGFTICNSIVMKYLEENLGKVHSKTIDLRKILNEQDLEINKRKSELIDNSGLQNLLIKRLENYEKI